MPSPRAPTPRSSALTVSPGNLIGFAADQRYYNVGVASTVTRVTITATATDSNASVAYSGTDADTSTTIHDVDLTAGSNIVNVFVTAEDGTAFKRYNVRVNRGVTDEFGWKAVDDLDGLRAAGNGNPTGIWSDGTTMWVADERDDKLYAYNTDGTRDSSKDFNTLLAAGNLNPWGIWSDGTTMWGGLIQSGASSTPTTWTPRAATTAMTSTRSTRATKTPGASGPTAQPCGSPMKQTTSSTPIGC